jgi:dolichol kinase
MFQGDDDNFTIPFILASGAFAMGAIPPLFC